MYRPAASLLYSTLLEWKWRSLSVVRCADHMVSEKSQWAQNGTMFVDLDWPLNAMRRLSASAELLVLGNNLSGDTTDFSSFKMFRQSLSNDYLTQLCKVNFNIWWLMLCSSLTVLYMICFIHCWNNILSSINMLVVILPFGVLNKWNEMK